MCILMLNKLIIIRLTLQQVSNPADSLRSEQFKQIQQTNLTTTLFNCDCIECTQVRTFSQCHWEGSITATLLGPSCLANLLAQAKPPLPAPTLSQTKIERRRINCV